MLKLIVSGLIHRIRGTYMNDLIEMLGCGAFWKSKPNSNGNAFVQKHCPEDKRLAAF